MNSISNFTSKLRLTGLSGFDTESMVSELMKAERIPLNALMQKRTLVEWRQAAYREVSSSLIGFKSKFFDIVNRSSYLLSANSVKTMAAKSSNSAYVTATASADAKAGTQSIKVLQLATADKTVSSERVSKPITGTVNENKLADLAGKKLIVQLDGVNKEITLGNITEDNLATELQTSLDDAFGKNKIKAEDGTEIEVSKFTVAYDKTTNALSINTANGATKVAVYGPSETIGESAGLADLGLTAGASNRISLKSTLASLAGSLSTALQFGPDDTVEFTINGSTISAKSTDTLEQVFSKINNDTKANAHISYDEVTDKITLTSKQAGEGNNLKLSESGSNFLAALNLGTITEGQDAKVLLNGTETLVRSSNTITVNGVTYTLNKVHDPASEGETITIEQDTDSVIKNVKSFVEEYNKLIASLNGKVSETYDRDYPPLTDEQKEAMEDEDIEKWEKKAKTGILRNDSLLQQITLSMRKALYEKIDGVGLTLKDIGISTGSYTEQGKLYLDEDKLKNALLNKPDEVTKLLNGVSPENPSYTRTLTKEQKADRYSKSGVFQRLADIIEDNVSTTRNADGKKGILLEKAGIEGDISNTENLIYEELEDFDDRIDTMIDRLTRKEENYYVKFSKLETMLNQMNQQSAWITSQFSSGQ